MRPSERARAYLATIKDNSPEDEACLWFENATYEEQLAAFIQLEVGIGQYTYSEAFRNMAKERDAAKAEAREWREIAERLQSQTLEATKNA